MSFAVADSLSRIAGRCKDPVQQGEAAQRQGAAMPAQAQKQSFTGNAAHSCLRTPKQIRTIFGCRPWCLRTASTTNERCWLHMSVRLLALPQKILESAVTLQSDPESAYPLAQCSSATRVWNVCGTVPDDAYQHLPCLSPVLRCVLQGTPMSSAGRGACRAVEWRRKGVTALGLRGGVRMTPALPPRSSAQRWRPGTRGRWPVWRACATSRTSPRSAAGCWIKASSSGRATSSWTP